MTNQQSITPETAVTEKTQQPIHIHTIKNTIGIITILDISQIKGH